MISSSNIPLSVKPASSIPESASHKKERYVLTFDFETTGLPESSWDNYEPIPYVKTRRDGSVVTVPKQTLDKNGDPMIYNAPVMLPASDETKWPHAIQFCFMFHDNKKNKTTIVNEIIRLPKGVTVHPESEKIHKISLEQSQGKTKKVVDPNTGQITMIHHPTIDEVLRKFMEYFRKADIVVAHNLRFDRNIMLCEMDRLRKKNILDYEHFIVELYHNKKEYCTSNFGGDVCKIIAVNKLGNFYYKMPKLKYLYEYLFHYAPEEDKLHDALIDVIVCFRCFYKLRYNMDICATNALMADYINSISPPQYKYRANETNENIIFTILEEEKEKEKEQEPIIRRSLRLASKPLRTYKL